MKKTLIALAVAASAAVSGSAMAWTANGNGGNVDLGGTLTPQDVLTPWEVKVGDAVSGLDADIRKGDTAVSITVNKAIPVLGIRVVDTTPFVGRAGISPQIDFNGAVDVKGFSAGVSTLTLDVTDTDGNNIGTMSAPFLAAAGFSRTGNNNGAYSSYVYSGYDVSSFTGGLGASSSAVLPNLTTVISRLNAIDSEFSANFDQQNQSDGGAWRSTPFENVNDVYNGFYGSGIEQGEAITITLNSPAGADAIDWKASLPVTVSYL
ncbi:TPA: hypothetical protein ACHUVK_002722 [Shigella sonnei]